MHLTSILYSAMEYLFMLSHETKKSTKQNVAPLVLFLSLIILAQYGLVNEFKAKSCFFYYHNPYSIVPFRYLRIIFTVVTCVSLRDDWNMYGMIGIWQPSYNLHYIQYCIFHIHQDTCHIYTILDVMKVIGWLPYSNHPIHIPIIP